MKKLYILIFLITLFSPLKVFSQKIALKPHVDIGVGSSMSFKSDIPDLFNNTSNIDFGVDFSFLLWEKAGNRIEANVGLGYSISNIKLDVNDINYAYMAPAIADIDGNPYIRNYQISDLKEKINHGYITLPIYITYGYRFNDRIGVHADMGFKLGLKSHAKLTSVEGYATSFGIYPEYDNLIIDNPIINGFGTNQLSDADKEKVEANSFYASFLIGAAFDVRIAGPVWLNAGISYNVGLTDSFKHKYNFTDFSSDSAPVSYDIVSGEKVKPLTEFMKSSKLSPFSIKVGLTIEI